MAQKRILIPDHAVGEFGGTNTYLKDITQLKDGETPDSLNWLTGQDKDRIELRGGTALLGTNSQTGSGRITGLGVGYMQNGMQVPFYTFAQKICYYNATTNLTQEISTTNILPAAAKGEDIAIMPYQNISGYYVYFSSPDSSIYLAAPSTPGSVTDLKSTAYRGLAKIDTNRMFMWQRKDTYGVAYDTQLFLSVSDRTTLSQYTQTTNESVGTGNGTAKTFNHTVASPAAFAVEVAAPIATGQTVTGISQATNAVVLTTGTSGFTVGKSAIITGVIGMTQINGLIGIVTFINAGVSVTLSINSSGFTGYSSGGTIYPGEYFIDNQNGVMTSDNGGTGTIDYVGGALSVTFGTAPLSGTTIELQYYTESPTTGGVADFTQNGAVNGQGKTYSQGDGGGNLMAVWPFDQVQYCFHLQKSWYLSLTNDDTQASNLPYRSNFGIPYWRAAFPTSDGILILDNSQPSKPAVEFMEVSDSVTSIISIIPTSISETLDLSPYGFNQCVARRFGNFDLIAFQNVTDGIVDNVNTRMFCRNINSGQWDLLDYAVSCLDQYNGTLIAGDSLSNNIYTLFSGFDDNNFLITNHWTSKAYLFKEGIKKCNRFVVRGLIQSSQNIDIYFSTDFGNFSKFFTVSGTGTYVNTGNPVIVGSSTVGSQIVGGGSGVNPPIIAYPYEVEFIIGSDIFEYIQVQFQANNIGYCSIDEYVFKDIRYKGIKSSPARTITN